MGTICRQRMWICDIRAISKRRINNDRKGEEVFGNGCRRAYSF